MHRASPEQQVRIARLVESSGPGEAPPLSSEHHVGFDRATMQFRKYYFDTLRGSNAV